MTERPILHHRGGTIRVADEADRAAPSDGPRTLATYRRRFDYRMLRVARRCENEFILFDEARRESWILYPPRSEYDFLKRPSRDSLLVEHRSWEPYREVMEHTLRPADGCVEHGLDCGAQSALEASLANGWDPFR